MIVYSLVIIKKVKFLWYIYCFKKCFVYSRHVVDKNVFAFTFPKDIFFLLLYLMKFLLYQSRRVANTQTNLIGYIAKLDIT